MHRSILSVVLLCLVVVMLQGPTPAHAAGPDEIFRAADSVTVATGETVAHDLFLAAQTINIDGTVQGDVAAAGQSILITGTIDGDLWAAGQSVVVNGRIRGDLRVASNTLRINGEVGRNVLVFANDASTGAQGRVGVDFVSYTARTSIEGEVRGDVSGTTAQYQRAGHVGGRELIKVEPREVEEKEEPEPFAQWLLGRARHWLSIMLVGALGAVSWRSRLLNAASLMLHRPLASLGSGVLVLGGAVVAAIVTIVVLVMVAIVLGSLGLGGLTAIAVITLTLADVALVIGLVLGALFVAGALASLSLGRLILEGRSRVGAWNLWLWLALGAVIYVIAGGLPAVGGLIQFVVALLGLGALGLAFWSAWRSRPAAAVLASQARSV